jgi:phospholipid/cholesterol/gamma-HCH transport system ATP-binding protein
MSIRIENIRKSFGDKEVLKGIDFTFNTGSVNMIIGGSGSGKTVLLKCIVGLLTPDTGKVYFEDRDFYALSKKEIRSVRRNIGMLFQSSALFDSYTIFENVAFPLRMFTNWGQKKIAERVHDCLERVNLVKVDNLLPSSLSGGMKKRAALARAIVMNPKYLFCDEPNSGLDPETGQVIDRLIQGLTTDFEMTTIVISHDIKSVLDIGDKIMFIYKGAKEWQGSKDEVLTAENPNLVKFIKTSGLM